MSKIAPRRECVLLLGDCQTREMGNVLQTVSAVFGETQIVFQSQLEESPESDTQPALVIVCQNWPDEFSSRTMSDLIRRFPLSRFLCCFSVWCEADGRTRDYWPLSIRVPARAAGFRIRQEWEIIQGQSPAFPLTAGRDELFRYETDDDSFLFDTNQAAPTIGVVSTDLVYRKMLQDLLVSRGGKVLSSSNLQQADLVLYDLDPWEVIESELEALNDLPDAIGLMGLAHPETVTAAKELGVEAIVSKVASAQELFQTIDRVLKLKETPEGVR